MKLVDVVNLKKDLDGVLKEVVKAAQALKFVAKKADLNFEHELVRIKVNVGQDYNLTS